MAQVVRDLGLAWAGPAVRLRLTGPEGGAWDLGKGGQDIELPAVEFMRHLSGRTAEPGLLDDVPAEARGALAAARVVF